MRKFISGFVILLMAVLVTAPFILGIFIQKKYPTLLSFYNLRDDVEVNVVDYQRNWFSSDVTLKVIVKNDDDLQETLKSLHAATTRFPPRYQFMVQQHIQHGPLIYWDSQHFPSIFGLAAIRNNVILSEDARNLLTALGIDEIKELSQYDFITYRGNYFNQIDLIIGKIQWVDRAIGPLYLQFGLHQFSVQSIENLLNTYKKMMKQGQVYQGQLRKKLFSLLPGMIHAGSAIELNQFDLTMPNGKIHMSAIIGWPYYHFVAPANLFEALQFANANAVIHVSKSLLNDIIILLENQKITMDAAKLQLNAFLKQGYIIDDGQDYTSSFRWTNGKLIVNGRVVQ
ncbi:MAG: hypothetical protein ACD_60C00005G0009 [uncultured bacterium]|nr:MAG: hypothetical protein ACD_60C00005G0009 [uncultured bacterium]